MLKRVLENLDGVDESLKGLYEERNGKFYLKVEDDTETGALRRAKDREAQEAKSAREKAADLEVQLTEARAALEAANGGKKKPDDLEKAWQAKYDKDLAAAKKQLDEKDNYIKQGLIDAAANKLAEVFTVPMVGAKLVKERLTVDFENGAPVLRVLDAAGAVSALTLDELKAELVDTAALAPMIVGSKASGGGASGAGAGRGGASLKPYEMTGAQRAEFAKRDPVGFKRAVDSGEFNPPARA